MTAIVPDPQPPVGLTGRRRERELLDRVVAAVRAGESRALVLHGEPGVGKTALLEYLARQASGCRLARAGGIQSEMELAFAGLHQLLGPMLGRLERIPVPQQDALRTVFGIRSGPPPNRFLVGLAVLSLLSEVGAEQPLICLVDDQQWFDHASAQVLAFAARRLVVESVGLVFAARVPDDSLAGLPRLVVEGLCADDALALLNSVLTGPLDALVRRRIVAETRGNPLALLELIGGLTPAELAGGFGLVSSASVSGDVEDAFERRVQGLPEETRLLLLLAAADPIGDPVLVSLAADRCGIPIQAAVPAAEAGLLESGGVVRFRHPLVRSVVYRSATPQERRDAHRVLAEVTDRQTDPDRRAWHRAYAAPEPNEEIAIELERSADRAQARAGLTASAAFLQRSAELTVDPAHLARRSLRAAGAKHLAGAPSTALKLLAAIEAAPLDDMQHARIGLLRGQIAFATNRGRDAPPLLLEAARRLESLDIGLARATYLETLSAVLFAGRLSAGGGGVLEVSHAVQGAPPSPQPPRVPDLLLDGLAANFCQGFAAGLPLLRRAISEFGDGMTAEEELRWLWLAGIVAMHIWDGDRLDLLSERHVRLARDAGALSELPLALNMRIYLHLFAGELAMAASLSEEARAATEATESTLTQYGALGLAALRGSETEAAALINASMREVKLRGEGIGIAVIEWATAVLYNGLGQYEKAMAAAQRATEYQYDLNTRTWGLAELVEAATRTGAQKEADAAHRQLLELVRASGGDWALGVGTRSQALVSEGEAADRLYRESIALLDRTRIRLESARSHLVYGEWLRRENRRVDARGQLRLAHDMFASMGVEGFADRARRELLATGETVRRRTVAAGSGLTSQEMQVARLARDGLSNPEIATRLFISPRTVQYHLGKVFAKLNIRSRSQLEQVLPSEKDVVRGLQRARH